LEFLQAFIFASTCGLLAFVFSFLRLFGCNYFSAVIKAAIILISYNAKAGRLGGLGLQWSGA
jgi:hypothetical protein